MASKGQMTGMLGVYLTAVELTKLGFVVSPTSRSARGADLLVTDQACRTAWSVQVKTNRSNARFWLVGAKTVSSPTHVYVFVSAPKTQEPKFYVIPSTVVASEVKREEARTGNVFHSYYRKDEYQDRWEIFGSAVGELPG